MQIVELFEKRNLHELCGLEQVSPPWCARTYGCVIYAVPVDVQTLVTGCDSEGETVKAKELERLMRGLMQDDRLTYVRAASASSSLPIFGACSSEDQCRLMILFILCHK